MSAIGSASGWARDLPVCFPGHPCVDYPPFEADAINGTSALTPVSQAIAICCFAVLGVGVVLMVLGSLPSGARLRVVVLALALTLTGVVVESVARLRLDAIAVIFGLDGPGSPDLYGSWLLVELAGAAMTVAGVAGLAITATIAVVRLHRLLGTRAGRH